MAILGDIVDVADAWGDGDFSFSDITAPIAVGADLLSAALDPVGALIAAPLGELLNFCVHHISFIKEPLAKLEGSDDLVKMQVEAWNKVAHDYVVAGNLHADGVSDLSTWTGDAATTYHEIMKATNAIFAKVAEGCRKMGLAVEAAGILVGMLRGFIWDMISELLTTAIEAGIAALAAAVPTLGASLAVFAEWYTAKVSAVGIKIFGFLEKLLARAQKFASKCKLLVNQIVKARNYCQRATRQLAAAQGLAGRTQGATNVLNAKTSHGHVPRNALPGDTTVGYRNGAGTAANLGPLSGGHGSDFKLSEVAKDTAKDQGKDAAKKVAKESYDKLIAHHDRKRIGDLKRIE